MRDVNVTPEGSYYGTYFTDYGAWGILARNGDELEAAQVLLNVRGDACHYKDIVKMHRANMEKLKARSDQFDRLVPAHNGGPLDVSYLDDYIALACGILNDQVPPCDTVAGYGWPSYIMGGDEKLLRYHLGRATFVCQKE